MYCGFMTLYWLLMQPIHFVTNSRKRGNVKLAAKQSHLAIIQINVEAHRLAWRWLPLSAVLFLALQSLSHCPSCVLWPAWSVILLPHPCLIADYDLLFSWSHRLNLVEVMNITSLDIQSYHLSPQMSNWNQLQIFGTPFGNFKCRKTESDWILYPTLILLNCKWWQN